jgi:hypothetical protein
MRRFIYNAELEILFQEYDIEEIESNRIKSKLFKDPFSSNSKQFQLLNEIDNISKIHAVLENENDYFRGAVKDIFEINEDLQIDGQFRKILLSDEKVAVFIGAGVSKLLKYPLWGELASKSIQHLWNVGKISFAEKDSLSAEVSDPKQILSIFDKYCSRMDVEGKQFYKSIFDKDGTIKNGNPYQYLVSPYFDWLKVTSNVEFSLVKALLKNYQNTQDENSSTSKSSKKAINKEDFFDEYIVSKIFPASNLDPDKLYYLHGRIDDFGSFEIFENASIQTMIMLFQKKQVLDDYKFELSKLTGSDHTLNDVVMLLDKKEIDNASYIEAKVNDSIRNGGYLVFTNQESELILEKIKKKGNFYLDKKEEIVQGIVPNPDVVNTRNIKKIPNSSVKKYDISVGDGVFVISKTNKDLFKREAIDYIKPLYHPNEVEKYSLTSSPSDFMIYLSKIEEDQVPTSLLNHLSKYKEIMEARRENKKGSRDYFELHWPRDEVFFTKGPKILSVRKCSEPTFTYTEAETYVMMAFNIIRSDRLNLKYAAGLLNSNLIKYWLKSRGKMQGNNFQIDNEPLSEIPIYKPDTDPGIADLVDQILSQKESDPETDTQSLEKKIDTLVYKLYNLTWEEVQVVDPEFGMSEEEYEGVGVGNE